MGSVIVSVEYFTIDLTSIELSGTYTLTKGQNTANCVPFAANNSGTSGDLRRFGMDLYFTGGDTLNTVRTNSVHAQEVRGWIVEFNPDYVTVQTVSFDITDGNSSDDVSVSTYVLADSIVVGYTEHGDGDNFESDDNLCRYKKQSTILVRAERQGTVDNVAGHMYLVESTLFTTQEIWGADINGLTSLDVSISTVDMDKTFILASRRVNSSIRDPHQRGIMVRLEAVDNIELTRDTSAVVSETFGIHVVECSADEFTVQRGVENMGTSLTKDVDFTDDINQDYSMVIGGMVYGGAISNNTANLDWPESCVYYTFVDNDTLRITKGEASGSSTGMNAPWQVVSWLPPGYGPMMLGVNI